MTKECEQITKEVQRVREEIIKWLARYDALSAKGEAPLVYETVNQILSIKGILIGADDQSLPQNKWVQVVNPAQLEQQSELWQCRQAGYNDAQKDMVNQNWRRMIKVK